MTAVARKIAVLTVGRSDFGRYRPVLRALKDDPTVALRLLVGGSHHSPLFGRTATEISDSGFDWEGGLEMAVDADTPARVGKTVGMGALSLSQAFETDQPDLLVLLGDRYEMLAGAAAALGFNLPIAHIHGGAVTEGAIDEQVRHALTKMSHLHCVSCDEYGRRVRQMGEEDWRVHVTGAPGLDELPALAGAAAADLARWLDMDISKPTLLVSFHPVTLEGNRLDGYLDALLDAIEATDAQIVLTYPNSDPGHQTVIAAFQAFASCHAQRARLIENAGTERFSALMAHATAMVGNSSAGIVEAPSFSLPVVNVGTRQDGKIRAANVIDCGPQRADVAAALVKAMNPEFRRGLAGLVNPYGDGKAGLRIAHILKTVAIDDRLLRKKFVDR